MDDRVQFLMLFIIATSLVLPCLLFPSIVLLATTPWRFCWYKFEEIAWTTIFGYVTDKCIFSFLVSITVCDPTVG